jgi:hypothetical protein
VLLAVDGLAADLLERRLREDADFDLVGRTVPAGALASARRTEPDFVVLPLACPPGEDAAELLDALPRMKVLTLEGASGRAYLTELVGDVSPDELADALRLAARRRTG